MKKITCIFILTSVLFGCSPSEVDYNLIQDRNGIAYLPNDSEPFTGTAVASYPSGQQQIVVSYENGKPSGISSEWYTNGQMRTEQHFSGEDEGRIRDWYENGEVARDINVLNGTLVGKNIWKSSDHSLELNVLDGLLNGKFYKSYPSGFIDQQFRNGFLLSQNEEFVDSEFTWTSTVKNELNEGKDKIRASLLKTRSTHLESGGYELRELDDSKLLIVKKEYEDARTDISSAKISQEPNEWKNIITNNIRVDGDFFEIIARGIGFMNHNKFDLQTGRQDGLSWLLIDKNIHVLSFKDGLKNGWELEFNRSDAKWKNLGWCYIEGEWEYDDDKCGLIFGKPVLPPKSIHKDYKVGIQKDKKTAQEAARIKKAKEAEAERVRFERIKAEEQQQKLEKEARKKIEVKLAKIAELERQKQQAEKIKRERELEAERKRLVAEKIERERKEKMQPRASWINPISAPKPKHPLLALESGVDGMALVKFTLLRNGKISNPLLLEEWPEGYDFGNSAIEASYELEYENRKTPIQGVFYKFIFKQDEKN